MPSFAKLKQLTRREKWLALTLVIFSASVAVAWRPLNRELLTRFVLRSDTALQETIDGLVGQSPDPASLLERLWQSRKIPHRLCALTYLKTHSTADPTLLARMESALVQAAEDGDLETRELGLELLARRKHPELIHLATVQLRDVDPAVRILGLNSLNRNGGPQIVPIVIPFLQDADPRVVVSADCALRNWTGTNFGIHLSLAVPQFNWETVAPEPAALQVLEAGVRHWQAWWKTHQTEFPRLTSEPAQIPASATLPVADFALEDLARNTVRLADFRGRVVLLNFWDMKTPSSLILASNLVEVQRRDPQRFVILGISLDSTTSEHIHDHEHGHEHGHGHAHGNKPREQPDLAKICGQLQRCVQDHFINYPILIDATGAIGRCFKADELPTTVLIGPDGNFRRRFTGVRTPTVLNAMLREIVAGRTPTGTNTGPIRGSVTRGASRIACSLGEAPPLL